MCTSRHLLWFAWSPRIFTEDIGKDFLLLACRWSQKPTESSKSPLLKIFCIILNFFFDRPNVLALWLIFSWKPLNLFIVLVFFISFVSTIVSSSKFGAAFSSYWFFWNQVILVVFLYLCVLQGEEGGGKWMEKTRPWVGGCWHQGTRGIHLSLNF